jgi:hypothetical protein
VRDKTSDGHRLEICGRCDLALLGSHRRHVDSLEPEECMLVDSSLR